MSTAKTIRCAVYTRKSTEEGLEQAFNSLDAQREACVAFIKSQAGEGWKLHASHYDDGGFSGGSMERPALGRLLHDIDEGHIDCVVVYKIDRLTRSLADFAKIVERFEKRGVTFVSVTQSFNTTTSMGRLTLNVLLSFAQFEREVTAERIRDKFAASRAKGIFMGGHPPLGYDARDRKLVINEPEAKTVRLIFQRYLDLKSIGKLRAELEAKGITTKAFVSAAGKKTGGGRWFVGPLRHVLRNPVYAGLARHKGKVYPGQHEAIIDKALFDQVQETLAGGASSVHRNRTVGASGLLTGLISDDRGNRMTPQWSVGRGGSRYGHYVSAALLQRRRDKAGSLPRAAAPLIDQVVLRCVKACRVPIPVVLHPQQQFGSLPMADRFQLSECVRRVVARVTVSSKDAVVELISGTKDLDQACLPQGATTKRLGQNLQITIPGSLKRNGGERHLENWSRQDWSSEAGRTDGPLTMALVRAHRWREDMERGKASSIDELAKDAGLDRRRVRELLRLAFLAPDIQKAILEGRQPATLSLERLAQMGPPASWAAQRKILGLSN